MKKFSLLVAAAAGLGLPTAALAQNSDRSDDFNGFYVSGTIGTTAQNNDGSSTVVFDTNRDGTFNETVVTSTGANAFSPGFCNGFSAANAPGGCRGDTNGLEYGVRLGYDARLSNNLVAGVLIEGSKSNAKDGTSAFSTTPAGYSFDRSLDYAVSARARLGFTPGGGGLFYITGGGSYAKVDHTFSTTNTANSFTPMNDGKMVWGWQAGGGAEVLLSKNLSLGVEYLYNRYNDDEYYVAVGQGTAGATNPFVLAGGVNMRPSETRYDYHSLRATLSFRF
ncbi:MAG: outer membrane protein [Novosphingobium sp.]